MAISDDLDQVAELCRTGAKHTLNVMLALGPKPDDPAAGLHWEQQMTRLQGQLNSLSALVSKLTAAAVLNGLAGFGAELASIGAVAKDAETKINAVNEVSELLTKLAKVLDLGLALLAASAAPSVASIAAAVAAGKAVAASL